MEWLRILLGKQKSNEVYTNLDHHETDLDQSRVICSCGWMSGYFPWADYLEEIEDAHLQGHVAEGKVIAHRFDG